MERREEKRGSAAPRRCALYGSASESSCPAAPPAPMIIFSLRHLYAPPRPPSSGLYDSRAPRAALFARGASLLLGTHALSQHRRDTAGSLYAGGLLIQVIYPEVSLWVGGLKAVMYTGGSFVLTIQVFGASDGWEALVAKHESIHGPADPQRQERGPRELGRPLRRPPQAPRPFPDGAPGNGGDAPLPGAASGRSRVSHSGHGPSPGGFSWARVCRLRGRCLDPRHDGFRGPLAAPDLGSGPSHHGEGRGGGPHGPGRGVGAHPRPPPILLAVSTVFLVAGSLVRPPAQIPDPNAPPPVDVVPTGWRSPRTLTAGLLVLTGILVVMFR